MGVTTIERFNSQERKSFELARGIVLGDCQHIVFDHSAFAKPIAPERRITPTGLTIETKPIYLPDGALTNSTDVSYDDADPSFQATILSKGRPFYLRRVLLNDPLAVASIDAGFFFLADEGHSPTDINFNLSIHNGAVKGLPNVTRPALYTSDGELHAEEVEAHGEMKIGSSSFGWVGEKDANEQMKECMPIVYNSSSCTIVHRRSEQTGSIRIVDEERNATPQREDVTDVIVSHDAKGTLGVQGIREGGGSDFFEGLFVVQFRNGSVPDVSVGDEVSVNSIGNLDLEHIESAVTVGPDVFGFPNKHYQSLAEDPSLGCDNPAFIDRRMARSVVYKLRDNSVHLRLFDGAPRTEGFKGISLSEVTGLLAGEDIEWAYYMDPGQSTRIVAREDTDNIGIHGNLHYMKWNLKQDMPFLWNYRNGRAVGSAVVIRRNS